VSSLLALALTCSWARAEADEETGPMPQDPHPAEPVAGPPGETPPPAAGFAGYKTGGGFRLESADGNYLLRLALQSAFAVEPVWTGGSSEFDSAIKVLRPVLRGNVVEPWVGYWVSVELSQGTPYLLDGYFDLHRWNEIAFRFGQQYTPMSRHEAFGPQQIFFPDYARTANYFWSGYERGATLYGSLAGDRFYYYAGVYGGTSLRNTVDTTQDYVVEARATVSPMGAVNANEFPFTPEGQPLPLRVSFTLQGFLGKLQTTRENYNPTINAVTEPPSAVRHRTYTAGGDLWVQGGPIIVFGEGYWSTQRADGESSYSSSYGAWGQVVGNVYKNVIGVGARVNWIQPNFGVGSDRLLSAEGEVAWFIHPPELVAKARYGWIDQKSPGTVALAGRKLPDVPGTSHVATLQLNLSF
jgi:hypothetical protein